MLRKFLIASAVLFSCISTSLMAQPVNDQCVDNMPIMVGNTTYDATLATTDGMSLATSTCVLGFQNDDIFLDLWYCFDAPQDGLVRIDMSASTYDTRIAIYDGCVCPDDPTLVIACDDDGGAGTTSLVEFNTIAGNQYMIRVGGFDMNAGTGDIELSYVLEEVSGLLCDTATPDEVNLSWTLPAAGAYAGDINIYLNGALTATLSGSDTSYSHNVAGVTGIQEFCVEGTDGAGGVSNQVCCMAALGGPANDTCATAMVITDGTHAFDNNLTSTEFPGSCGLLGSDLWYRYTATDVNVRLTTCNLAGFDTAIAVYNDSGVCPVVAGDEVACNDDACGLQSELNLTLVIGQDYLVQIGGFNGATGAGSFSIGAACDPVTGLTCQYDCNTDQIDLAWTNPSTYADIEILRDGMSVGMLGGMDLSFSENGLAAGTYNYEVIGNCANGGVAMASCTVNVLGLSQADDLILHLEGLDNGGVLGNIDSGSALSTALTNIGSNVVTYAETDFATNTCVDSLAAGAERIWVLTGTFGDDYRMDQVQLDFIAGLAAQGKGIYFEGGDHWGFQHVDSMLDARDGIEEDLGANIEDGDDTFTAMNGANAAAAGLDLSANMNVVYNQDQGANDWTDQLSVSGTTTGAVGDVDIVSAEVTWTGLAGYITGAVAIHSDGGVMISQSWEFGGFGGDQDLLAADYVQALGGMGVAPGNEFIRGDCNIDGSSNLADIIFILGIIFPSGAPNVPLCTDACDFNDDGSRNLADAITGLNALFSGQSLPAPFTACGGDPTNTDSFDCATSPMNCP